MRTLAAALAAASILPFLALSSVPAFAQAIAPSGREVVSLSSGWQFHFGGAASPEASRTDGWQAISVPHSWNRLGGRPEKDAADDMRRGQGWYRLNLRRNTPLDGKSAFLEFSAASIVTDVWLNGIHLGQHKGAFGRFRFDVSAALRQGDNQLIVRTDNSAHDQPGSVTSDVPPIARDWFMFGGLYRGVSLIVTDPVHVDLLDHGSSGLFAHTESLSSNSARIAVRAALRNDGVSASPVRVETAILDSRGRIAAQANVTQTLAAGSTAHSQSLTVTRPRLWNGVADPYLYSVRLTVRDTNGRILDRVTQPLGIREIRLDAQRGFLLNGKVVKLHGVAMHQDNMERGWAVTPQDHERDFALLRELGANTVRLAHYQHDEQVYDLADRYGIILWTEQPLVNRASPEGSAATTPGFEANAAQQLRELIRQNYNHPSIAVWGIGNEVNFDAAMQGQQIETIPLLKTLDALVKQEDNTRTAVIADCCGAFGDGLPGLPARGKLDTLLGVTDAVGLNRYFGWYSKKPGYLTEDLDRVRAAYPALPVGLSEYGGGGALSQHSDNPTGGPVNSIGRPHPEEYQAWLHEQLYPQIAKRSDLWGSWVWSMFDFASPMRQEGDLLDTNDKGLVSYDRLTRKDVFYYYKAQWNSAPMAHLTGVRHANRAYPVVEVKAYSNAAELRLRINGRDAGKASCPGHICIWTNVPLTVGENRVSVSGMAGGKRVEDNLIWHRAPASTLYAIPAGVVTASGTPAQPIGSDAFFEGGEAHDAALPPNLFARGFKPIVPAGGSRPELYKGWRSGSFSYVLPVPAGKYHVRLSFFEPDEAVQNGQRTFSVDANGITVLSTLDVREAAGAARAIIERSFDVDAPSKVIKLLFSPLKGEAVVTAIEISPAVRQ